MKISKIQRLPETRSLSQILPKGTEGGKEFARIVDLLLFHDARRNGRILSLFSDASGDYNGLDSFAGEVFRRDGVIGYQYKFFPSPLSQEHRTAIKESLSIAVKANRRKKQKLETWILVTPDDFTESARKKNGGDVSWFIGLKKELRVTFNIEHWGHRHLQALFIETRSLSLFYYPELVPDGISDRRSVEAIRIPYDNNLLQTYRRIEFVGMSVYKPEATRGVPMEDIYIPLSTVPNTTAWDDESTPRTNPLEFLTQGRRQVILGDPGSGKSTLLRFLALVGTSAPLQQRCNAQADSRLPILIVLRKYAAELKKAPNLPLLDYIIQSINADFSLNAAGKDFFLYYLECGQAILLFDGLDELGSSNLKKTMRDRIQSFATTYPGNTVIVTSRIVGYEPAFGFDTKEYAHHRVGRLRKPEITQFVQDWYRARIENEKERDENAADLTRLLTEDAHVAIQDLAKNPLLLTIIALVHRIDAVLPDERVVLYQKCTETLLNTWHTWKFREVDVEKRGKMERRNRQRMEAIAHWMQTRPRTGTGNPRAVVKKRELTEFLSNYIKQNEPPTADEDATDLADDFIEFVRQRAGLLIEVGDNQFSFVHLTFQEYLAASWFKTRCEKDGVELVWRTLARCASDTSWHEVIRLLVASLTSDDAQEVLVKRLLTIAKQSKKDDSFGVLIAGLLVDGVEAAEAQRPVILQILIDAAASTQDPAILSELVGAIRACDKHDDDSRTCIDGCVRTSWLAKKTDPKRLAKLVTILLCEHSMENIEALVASARQLTDVESLSLRVLFGIKLQNAPINNQRIAIATATLAASALKHITISPEANIFGTLLPAIVARFDPKAVNEVCFRLATFAMHWFGAEVHGPFTDFYRNFVALSRTAKTMNSNDSLWTEKDVMALNLRPGAKSDRTKHEHQKELEFQPAKQRGGILKQALKLVFEITIPSDSRSNVSKNEAREIEPNTLGLLGLSQHIQDIQLNRDHLWDELSMRTEPLPRLFSEEGRLQRAEWILRDVGFRNAAASRVCKLLELEPKCHLSEIFSKILLPALSRDFPFLKRQQLEEINLAFDNGTGSDPDVSGAAFLLLVDSVLWIAGAHEQPEQSHFVELANATRPSPDARLRLAHCIRDLAYGNKQRQSDLVQMVKSPDREMRQLLNRIFWVNEQRAPQIGERRRR